MPLDPRVIEELRTIDTLVLALILAVLTLGGLLMRATVQLDELRARQRAHQIEPVHPLSSIKVQMYRAKADGRNRVRARVRYPAGFWGLNLRALDREASPPIGRSPSRPTGDSARARAAQPTRRLSPEAVLV